MQTEKIYMIRHNMTGRMYIGRSKRPDERTKHHFVLLRAGKHPVEDMQKDFDEYGDDFSITILCDSTRYDNNSEIEMMEKYRSCVRGIGYNYNDPHIKARGRGAWQKSTKRKIHDLVDTLNEDQINYAYTLLSKLYGEKGA